MGLEEEIGQKSFQNDAHKGIINIIYTANWILNNQKSFFKDYEITYQQYNILRILRGQHPSPCNINTLKDRMLDKMSDASRLVDRLHKKGLLERTTNSQDRRAVDILISKKGLNLLTEMDPLAKEMEDLLSSLSEEEKKSLNKLLDKIRTK